MFLNKFAINILKVALWFCMPLRRLAVQWKARIKLEILITLNCEFSMVKGFFYSQYALMYNCVN